MSESLSQPSTSDDEYVLPAPVDVHPDDPIVHGLRWRQERDELRAELDYIHAIAGRFVWRGHCGFEPEEVSEALAVALQELSLIRRRSADALGRERS